MYKKRNVKRSVAQKKRAAKVSESFGTASRPDERVSVFFAADDRYLPYLSVALSSLSDTASSEYEYDIYILSSEFSEKSCEAVRALAAPNIHINLCDVRERIVAVKGDLAMRLRDYYSESIYYRMFIPSLFPELDRAVYLDSDIVLTDDVAKLYFARIGDNLLGAVTDETVITNEIFCDYVKRQIGISRAEEYFNSGVLLMNLKGFREAKIEDKFLHLLKKYNFNTVAPDQDYLNYLCRGRVHYFECGWNKHPIQDRDIPMEDTHILHFNMFNKPWHYKDVPREEYFWKYAEKTPFYEAIKSELEAYTDEKKAADMAAGGKLVATALEIYRNGVSLARLSDMEFAFVKTTRAYK